MGRPLFVRFLVGEVEREVLPGQARRLARHGRMDRCHNVRGEDALTATGAFAAHALGTMTGDRALDHMLAGMLRERLLRGGALVVSPRDLGFIV